MRDGTVYFAASVWPFMGTFIYAIDAETGGVRWVNDSTGSQYIKQPHGAPSFAGVAPQGALVATKELLLVPGGRSVPAAFERKDGAFRYFEINAGGKGTGGSFVAADDRHFYVHTRRKGTRAFDLRKGVKKAFRPNEPVLAGGFVYSAEIETEKAKEKEPKKAMEKHTIRAYGADQKLVWKIDADGTGDLILAGDHLYAAGEKAITAIRLPRDKTPARIVQTIPVEGKVERLLVSDGKLFAVTLEGQLLAFGEQKRSEATANAARPHIVPTKTITVDKDADRAVSELLAAADPAGYAFWYGASDETLVNALAAKSPFVQLAIVDPDAARVDRLRRRFDAAGVYGKVTAHRSQARSFMPPKHVANVVFVGSELAATADRETLSAIYESVRPFGGVMHLLAKENRRQLADSVRTMKLEQAQVDVGPQSVRVRRVGPLRGSADWTHQYGDVANTIKSNDRRVKLPLGVLWFGGNSNVDVLPRHGHGPPEQVVGGRLFIQGMNHLTARDVYTGRVLWKREFKNLGTFDVYYDNTYKHTPLDPSYNQVHIPGANGRGTNYVVTDDRVYIIEGNACRVLDPATGKTLRTIELSAHRTGQRKEWGYIGVYQDVLIGGLGFANYRDRNGLEFESDKTLKGNRAGFGSKSLDRAASIGLVGFDRYSGKVLWRIDANHSFWHNGIVAGGGKVFCLDKNPQQVEAALKRRGKSSPDTYRILAIDHRTGERKWEVTEGIFGTWLGYSESKDLLLQAGAAASDRLLGEVTRGMTVYEGKDGKVRWRNESLKYAGPCILHHDLIITNANSYTESAGAFRIDDGVQKMTPNPLTGKMRPWKLKRTYGCNNVIASENLLTFRSGAAGFYDLLNDSGTGNFGGFKSGCTSNLVVANGVLNAPDYTRTCSCAYQNQTSLALVHMPGLELWTVNSAADSAAVGQEIRHLGVNFGAPGDRRDADGLLWLEYPNAAGDTSPLSVKLNPEAGFFRQHATSMAGREHPWVLSSGVERVTEVRIGLKVRDKITLRTGVPIRHVDDDAEEDENGDVELNSSDLELVENDSTAQLVGLRFNNIKLARGAEVRSAHIQFTCDEVSRPPASLLIAAEDSGDAERFLKDSHDISLRPRTKVEVDWSPQPWLKSGDAKAAQKTPDLAKLVRAVINRPDWKSGNSLAFLISGIGKRTAVASSGSLEKAAKLIIDAEESPSARELAAALRPHRVKLFFAAPKTVAGVERSVFDVYLQGERVIANLTIEPGGSAVHVVAKVMIGGELVLRFEPKVGQPRISGIELIQIED